MQTGQLVSANAKTTELNNPLKVSAAQKTSALDHSYTNDVSTTVESLLAQARTQARVTNTTIITMWAELKALRAHEMALEAIIQNATQKTAPLDK